MGCRISSFIIKWVNFLTLGVAIGVVGFGIWLSSRHGDCDKFLTVPVFVLGVIIFITSFLGFVGAWKDLVCVLCVYLVIMFFLLVGLALFTAFAFVVTNEGAGRAVSGLRFKEYNLGDYSGYIRRLFNDRQNWKHLEDCLLGPEYCVDMANSYDPSQLVTAQLNSIQSGCCRPPAVCNFPMINITYYNLSSRYIPKSASNVTSFHVTYQTVATVSLAGAPTPQLSASSSATMIRDNTGTSVLSSIEAYQSPYRKYDDSDCITYDNDPTSMCFTCSSCKAGVAQYIKKDWRLVAVINIIIFTLIVAIYVIGCCARRNASRAQYIKV